MKTGTLSTTNLIFERLITMYKTIQAFFKTENDAEAVKALLNKLKTNDLRVDQLPEEGIGSIFLVPLTYGGNNSTGTGTGSPTGAAGGVIAAAEQSNDDSAREHVLEAKVEEEDLQEALKIIMENDGHVDRDSVDF